MNSYHNILSKLSQFTKKYYTKILIKGILLFLALGILFFIVTLGVEYFLWLSSRGRLVLLFIFIAVEFYLLFTYILTPIFYLFKIKKGISNRQASLIIGKHFPDVGDKLYNLLDLKDGDSESELVLASIEQRSEKLNPIPFSNAIDFKENSKYLKYVAIPVVVLGLLWFSGNWKSFFGSYDRVVNYDLAYEPPAPFSFKLLTDELTVLNTKSHTIQVTTVGDVRPESIAINVNGNKLVLQQDKGIYQYTFTPPLQTTEFSFEADEVSSKAYTLNALSTPTIQDFKLLLEYPSYTNKPSEVLESSGNASFPEGTKVTWQINGRYTDRIQLISEDITLPFKKKDDAFKLSMKILSNFPYQLSTSNNNISNYEKLEYEFTVLKDEYPSIKANQVIDSLNPNTLYYFGEASDDYKLHKISLIWYANDDVAHKQELNLGTPNANFKQFYYTFPSGLDLEVGKNYSYYFEATDNDAIHKGKSSKSQIFTTTLLDDDQLKNKELEAQQSIIKNLDKSLEKFKEQKESLQEINQEQNQKKELNFNDKNQIKDFLQKQQRQENMMQKFSKQLKENLEKKDADNQLNKLLKERLERQEIEAKKNEKLLEQLNKIADKISKDDLKKKLEEIGKKQKNSERNLEQLLELTKRYYVTEKAAQLGRDLEKLAEKQDKAADNEEKSTKEQEELNEEFNKLSKELKELEKDNKDLKKPLKLDISSEKEEGVKKDQQEASESLKNAEKETSDSQKKEESSNKASKKQKSAAEKMKEMSEQLQKSSAGGGGGSTITEDAEMLRQILDNLVTFSFKQEHLFETLEASDFDAPQFSGTIRKQQELRGLFEHVDDSLFALSLRRAELSEFVNEQITEVYYNIDKSLETIAENQLYQGASYQKYVVSASNSLADFLAKILDNMQDSMQSGEGEGEGQSFQLPDIIKSQGDLQEKLNGQGEKEGEGEGKQGKDGKQGQGQGQGSSEGGNKPGGQSGEGKSGSEGKSGNSGQGNGGQSGEGEGGEGNSGKNGKGKGKDGQAGSQGQGGDGQNGPSEEELKEIYEIYKQQQQIRAQLEEQLKNLINNSDRKLGEKLVRQMEDFENDLLENGFTSQGVSKINNIQYELLKLENAALKQGKKPERESNSNSNDFVNPITTKPSLLDNYRNEIEILNRQALPLRQNYQNKVKEYFEDND